MSAWLTSAPLSTRNCTTSMFSSMHACKGGGGGWARSPQGPHKGSHKDPEPKRPQGPPRGPETQRAPKDPKIQRPPPQEPPDLKAPSGSIPEPKDPPPLIGTTNTSRHQNPTTSEGNPPAGAPRTQRAESPFQHPPPPRPLIATPPPLILKAPQLLSAPPPLPEAPPLSPNPRPPGAAR